MEFREESFLTVRQDGIPSWCFFAANGHRNKRSYGGTIPTGLTPSFYSFRTDTGVLDCLIAEAITAGGYGEVETADKKPKKGMTYHEYGMIVLLKPVKAGEKINEAVHESIPQDVRDDNVTGYLNVQCSYYVSQWKRRGYDSIPSPKKRKKKDSIEDVPVQPLMLPGIGLYQTCVEGTAFNISTFTKSLAKLARFCRVNPDCEIRVDFPSIPDDTMRGAVEAMFMTLPANVVVVKDNGDQGGFFNDPDMMPSPVSPIGLPVIDLGQLPGAPKLMTSGEALETIKSVMDGSRTAMPEMQIARVIPNESPVSMIIDPTFGVLTKSAQPTKLPDTLREALSRGFVVTEVEVDQGFFMDTVKVTTKDMDANIARFTMDLREYKLIARMTPLGIAPPLSA